MARDEARARPSPRTAQHLEPGSRAGVVPERLQQLDRSFQSLQARREAGVGRIAPTTRGLLRARSWPRSRARRRCPARSSVPGGTQFGPARRVAHHPLGSARVQPATHGVVQLAGPAAAALRDRPSLPIPRHRRRQIWLWPPPTPVPDDGARRHGQHPPRMASWRNRAPPDQKRPDPRPGLVGQGHSQPPPNAACIRRRDAPCGTTILSGRHRSQRHARRD